jgi:hypothetical protein
VTHAYRLCHAVEQRRIGKGVPVSINHTRRYQPRKPYRLREAALDDLAQFPLQRFREAMLACMGSTVSI